MMRAHLIARGHEVVLVTDPPEEEPWGDLRGILLGNREMTTIARATVFLAARLDSVSRVILPALEKGAIVIAARYYDSWFAYQIAKLSPGIPRERAFNLLLGMHSPLIESGFLIQPTRTYLITGNPKTLAKRGKEKEATIYDEASFQAKVQRNFMWLAPKIGARRVKVVDGRRRKIKELFDEIRSDLEVHLSN